MTATMTLPFKLEVDAEWKQFWNWLVVWVVLANIGFMTMWFIGGPTRGIEIMTVGILGLIVRRMSYLIQVSAFILCLAVSAIVFVGNMFNLSFLSILYSLKFFAELKPNSSIEYIVIGSILLLILLRVLFVLKKPSAFGRISLFVLGLLILAGLTAADYAVGQGMRGHYKREAAAGSPFESATGQTSFAERADGKRHLILIMVESLGAPKNNAEMERLTFKAYRDDTVKDLYEVQQGTSLYYNSTTAGEVREMCGRWGDYYELLEKLDEECMPAQLAAKGYDTQAIHSFVGNFFDRETWYPNIGFKERQFLVDLQERGIDRCIGVFSGACDYQIPSLIGDMLKNTKKPTFLYWLTLNTHLPVPNGILGKHTDCAEYSNELSNEYPMICRQMEAFDAIDRGIVEQITAVDFPDADILIVGDHMPPYFDRKHRSQFDPNRIPWIHLKRK